MDTAYDHIAESTLSPSPAPERANDDQTTDLNTELQEKFKAFSASPWGARLGGFFGNVKKQSETYYEGARQEYNSASEEALKGFTDLRGAILQRTRGMSLGENPAGTEAGSSKAAEAGDAAASPATESEKALQDNDGFISRFRSEASKRLKDIEKAEDAADEALLKFGTNIRNFLRDAVTIAPPSDSPDASGNKEEVLFESKDSEGKRVIHTTRFDAQMHAIHSSLESFMKDPISDEWPKWVESFKIEQKTDDIAKDLEKYMELRRAMEKLVPENVEYADFWRRYYFLRHVIETEEARRRELLKGT